MKTSNNVQPAITYVVTVTYGDRFKYLSQVVSAALESRALKVVIVDNGTTTESGKSIRELERNSEGRVAVVELPENLGSADGYKSGIEYAYSCPECDYIWLLDDDNLPAEGALVELINQYDKLNQVVASNRLALVSVREDWEILKKIALGESTLNAYPRKSSFMWFHVMDQPKRFLAKFCQHRMVKETPVNDSPIEIPIAPYGGLFFHKSVISILGYPDERFFLYHDDTEYTYRLTRRGGKIFLVPSSIVNDLEDSWHMSGKKKNIFIRLLTTDSDLRIYYGTRNLVYFERNFWAGSLAAYTINKWLFFVLLCIFCLGYGKWKRFYMIVRAARHGELGKLGRVSGLKFI